MALSDWTINKSDPTDTECGIYTISPILGTGSLRIKDNGSSNVSMYNTTYTNGLTRGRMRMLVRIQAQGGIGTYRTGFYFHTNNTNIATGTPTFYSAHILLTASLSSRQYAFAHYAGGMSGTETIFYTSSPLPTMVNGTTILPLEVEWHYETELDGVRVIVRGDSDAGDTLTDFSNLTTLSTFIISNSLYKITTSVGEGIYFYGNPSPSGSEIEYDSVSIYSLTP
jgi:hypothetical protein